VVLHVRQGQKGLFLFHFLPCGEDGVGRCVAEAPSSTGTGQERERPLLGHGRMERERGGRVDSRAPDLLGFHGAEAVGQASPA
jgi:hypothetical protein